MTTLSSVETARCCVQVVNQIDGTTKTDESHRDRAEVLADLVALVLRVNEADRTKSVINGCVFFRKDAIRLVLHCPFHFSDFAIAVLQIVSPLREAERIIWGGGPQA